MCLIDLCSTMLKLDENVRGLCHQLFHHHVCNIDLHLCLLHLVVHPLRLAVHYLLSQEIDHPAFADFVEPILVQCAAREIFLLRQRAQLEASPVQHLPQS